MFSRFSPYIQRCLIGSIRQVHSETSSHLNFCVVGSGPAGFYTVDRILKRFPDAQIDIIEALPTPFGLVRSGVAPDHPDTKNVINQFTAIAKDPRVCFFGNTRVGNSLSTPTPPGILPLERLRPLYNAVILAYGAEGDKKLGIPGENLHNIFSAREFVMWYNGYPSTTASHLPIDLRSVHSVAICGLGNVALDCARILLRPIDELAKTDIAKHAVHALKESAVKEVHLIGRRGPAQAAFTPKELRELLHLEDITVHIHPEGCLNLEAVCREEISKNRIQRRVIEVLTKIEGEKKECSSSVGDVDSNNNNNNAKKSLHFHFLRSPLEFLSISNDSNSTTNSTNTTSIDGVNGTDFTKTVTGIKLDINTLQPPDSTANTPQKQQQRATSTGQIEILPSQLVLTSIGYSSIPIQGVSFNSKQGIIPNTLGQVLKDDGSIDPGLFVCGWLKRGPSGIIGTNLVDAEQTVDTLSRWIKSGLGEGATHVDTSIDDVSKTGMMRENQREYKGREGLKELLQQIGWYEHVISFDDWERIDQEELKKGRMGGKSREKIVSVDEMIEIARKRIY